MTEQHRADPKLWAAAEKWGANTMDMANCTLELRDRVEALEATQHAHIEAKAAGVEATEAGVRYAIEQLRSRPGSWQPLKVETTYGSDASIPELSQSDVKAAEIKWARTAPGMRSDATDRVLDLQDQIRDGESGVRYAMQQAWELAAEQLPQDKLGRLIEQDRSDPRQLILVERVADAIGAADDEGLTNMTWSNHSRAAIRAVAAWINERELKAQNDPYCLAAPTADEVLGWLRNEADR
jgi:hypothetical protein